MPKFDNNNKIPASIKKAVHPTNPNLSIWINNSLYFFINHFTWFKNNSNSCLCFFTTTSNITPQINNKLPITAVIPETITVGIFATIPVSKNVINTGVKKHKDIIQSIIDIIVKKANGLYSLNSLAIVFNTFIPSETVFNFDSLPSGRSLYWMGNYSI